MDLVSHRTAGGEFSLITRQCDVDGRCDLGVHLTRRRARMFACLCFRAARAIDCINRKGQRSYDQAHVSVSVCVTLYDEIQYDFN